MKEEIQYHRLRDLISALGSLCQKTDGHAFSLQPWKLVVKYFNDGASSVFRKGAQGHCWCTEGNSTIIFAIY